MASSGSGCPAGAGKGQGEPGDCGESRDQGDTLECCGWDWLCHLSHHLQEGSPSRLSRNKMPCRDRWVWEPRPLLRVRAGTGWDCQETRWAMARCHPHPSGQSPAPLPWDSWVHTDPAPASSPPPEWELGSGPRGLPAHPWEGAACGGQGEYRGTPRAAPHPKSICDTPADGGQPAGTPPIPAGTGAPLGQGGVPIPAHSPTVR